MNITIITIVQQTQIYFWKVLEIYNEDNMLQYVAGNSASLTNIGW